MARIMPMMMGALLRMAVEIAVSGEERGGAAGAEWISTNVTPFSALGR
jgi:hypothetical protein